MGSEAESIEVVFTEATLPESINSCFGMSQIRHTEDSFYHFSEDAFMAQPSGQPCYFTVVGHRPLRA